MRRALGDFLIMRFTQAGEPDSSLAFMLQTQNLEHCFHQYRIILVEPDHLIAECSMAHLVTKSLCNLEKNHISQDFIQDQVVYLKVKPVRSGKEDFLLVPQAKSERVNGKPKTSTIGNPE